MMFKSSIVLSLAATALSQQSLTQLLSGNSNLSGLTQLINSDPALAQSLGSLSNVTLLAPSNAALSALLNTTAGAALQNNSAAVAALLQYHVLNGTYSAAQVTNSSAFIPTALTNPTYANVTGGQRVQALRVSGNVTIFSGLLNNSTVTQADQNFTGGTVHVINRVLTVPRNLSSTLVTARLTALYGALNATNLLGTAGGLRDVTIFAPNNSAFANIANLASNLTTEQASRILRYHVISGQTPLYSSSIPSNASINSLEGSPLKITKQGSNVFVNGARVILPDVLIAGGVVHVIDQVLNPANTTAAASSATSGIVAFSGASSASNIPFTSGVPEATTTLGGGATRATSTGGSSSSSSKAAAAPMNTGAVGAAALFGAGALLLNM